MREPNCQIKISVRLRLNIELGLNQLVKMLYQTVQWKVARVSRFPFSIFDDTLVQPPITDHKSVGNTN